MDQAEPKTKAPGSRTSGSLTTSSDHIKGNPRGFTKSRKGKPGTQRTQSDVKVIERAQKYIEDNNPAYTTQGHDRIYEIPRSDPKSTKAPRKFAVHKGGGDGKTTGLFEIKNDDRDADSKGEFTDTDSDS